MTNIAVSALSGAAAAGAIVMVTYVRLQETSPGIQDNGHTNISGNSMAGRFGANTSPTLARVQVSETGSLQGVRSITNTGVSVYGQSTGATGLGYGGYFTSSSTGGRAIVGDALSASGNTVGGLFYNRSSGGGVGVWGRAIGGGTATGVLGDTSSATGVALAANNSSTSDSMQAAGPNGSLFTSGKLPQHEYTNGTASAMVPVAYGIVSVTGAHFYGSPNWSGSHPGTGLYDIDVANAAFDRDNSVIVGSSYGSGGVEVVTIESPATGDFRLAVRDGAGTLIDSSVYFIVYRTVHSAPSVAPEPPMNAKRFREDIDKWAKQDPKGFEEYRKAFMTWQNEQMKVKSAALPTDDARRP